MILFNLLSRNKGGKTGPRGTAVREQHSLRLVPRRCVGKQGGVPRRLHVGLQVGSGGEPCVAAVTETLVDLPPNEVDQLHLLIEI